MVLVKGIPCTPYAHSLFKLAQDRLSVGKEGKKYSLIESTDLIIKEYFLFKGWEEKIVPK